MLVDGKAIAEEVVRALEEERRAFGALSLGVVMNEGDAATESFVKIKSRVAARLNIELRRVSPERYEEAFACDGVIVQLPLPNAEAVLAALPPEKDVDGLCAHPLVRPPVAEAVAEVLARHGVSVQGKKAVVVGAGRLVGAPVASMLRGMGAEVEVVTEASGSLEALKTADLAVLGAGQPGLITPDLLMQGVVLIDAGTSESAGKLAGDADPACAQVASIFTPVPGGIGPIAVAMIFKNLLLLAKKNSGPR